MSALTERQMHDLAGRLTRLRAIDSEICEQIDALINARIRYHRLHAESAGQFGLKNLPPVLPEIHGPRPGKTR